MLLDNGAKLCRKLVAVKAEQNVCSPCYFIKVHLCCFTTQVSKCTEHLWASSVVQVHADTTAFSLVVVWIMELIGVGNEHCSASSVCTVRIIWTLVWFHTSHRIWDIPQDTAWDICIGHPAGNRYIWTICSENLNTVCSVHTVSLYAAEVCSIVF